MGLAPTFERHGPRVGGSMKSEDEDENKNNGAGALCDVLGIEKPNNVLRDFDDDEKGACTIRTLGGPQEMLTVLAPSGLIVNQ